MDGVAAKLAFEKQLKSMGFDMGTIAQLIGVVNDDAMCGPECQRQKKLAELKDAMTAAQNVSTDAPSKLAEARKNYYVYRDGEKGYLNAQLEAKRQEAIKKTDTLQDEFGKRVQRTQTLIDEYEAMMVYNQNTDEMLDNYITTNQRLTKEIDTTKANIFTNDRRFYYYDQAIDWQWYVNKAVSICYWAITAVYVAYYLVYKGHYSDRHQVAYGIVLALLPFMVTRILTFTMGGYSIQGFMDRMMNAVIGYV